MSIKINKNKLKNLKIHLFFHDIDGNNKIIVVDIKMLATIFNINLRLLIIIINLSRSIKDLK